MPHAEVDGRSLHHVRRGAGEPLLLVQGLSGNHLHWGEPFLELLERDFDVIAYDHRGIGHSDPAGGAFTIADLADDAAGLLAVLGVDRAHVLGISMGGMVAQELALRHPERLRTLALGCTYPGGEGSALTDPATIQTLVTSYMTGNRDVILKAGWDANVSPAYAADPDNFLRFSETALQLAAPLPTLLAQYEAISKHDALARLETIATPTLIIHGTEDRMLPVINARLMAEHMPHARLEIFDGVGHLFWIERPERTAALLCEHAASAAAHAVHPPRSRR